MSTLEEQNFNELVELINSGALPTNLEEISSRTVEASFGEKALDKTLLAGLIGIILVVILIHFLKFQWWRRISVILPKILFLCYIYFLNILTI